MMDVNETFEDGSASCATYIKVYNFLPRKHTKYESIFHLSSPALRDLEKVVTFKLSCFFF